MQSIKKVYFEATSMCNLSCPMCSRNYWVEETPVHMDFEMYERTVGEVLNLPDVHTIFFGGVGEPLFHPRIVEMITLAKSTGKRVELITNGSMLDERMCEDIMAAGLDMLWVSIDSVEAVKFEQITFP